MMRGQGFVNGAEMRDTCGAQLHRKDGPGGACDANPVLDPPAASTPEGGPVSSILPPDPDSKIDHCARARRRLLGDVLVDDLDSPVAAAARSSFRLGWDAALEGLAESEAGALDGDGLTPTEQTIAQVIWDEFRKQYHGDAPDIEPRSIAQAITDALTRGA